MVTGFSNQSQAQMFRTFASLDLSPMAGRKLVMVTLTYPLDWQTVAGSSKQTQRHLRRFRSRYGSEFGEPCAALVKLEFQQRGAPHHHLLTTLPPTGRSGLPFREWISRTWADIVNHPDPEQRELHEKAGTRVDEMTGSPSKVVGYFAKYSMFKDKRYQHVVPREWLDTGGARRFWTSWALEKDLHSTYLDPTRDAKDIRRGLRDVDRARRKRKPTYRKHYTYLANEVNYETGEIRLRKVKRSTDLFRMSGGFLLIDNPMKIVDQITRNLEVIYPRNE